MLRGRSCPYDVSLDGSMCIADRVVDKSAMCWRNEGAWHDTLETCCMCS